MTSEVIGVPQPNLQTATVSLKMVQVGKKQMTLSVFRQLTSEWPFNEDLSFRGMPWGFVNYFWPTVFEREWRGGGYLIDQVYKSGNYVHLLWQDGVQLKRTVLEEVNPKRVQELVGDNSNFYSHLNNPGYPHYMKSYMDSSLGKELRLEQKERLGVFATEELPLLKSAKEKFIEQVEKYKEGIQKIKDQGQLFIAVG